MSVLTSTSGASGLIQLIQTEVIQPLERGSIAGRVSTTFRSQSSRVEVPVIASDPAVGWIAEGAEITSVDPTFTTISVIPKKLAGVTAITNEMIASGSRDAVTLVMDSLVRDFSHKLDAAYFGSVSGAPTGLASLSGVTALTTDLVTLDVFDEARIEAAKLNESVGAFVTDPDTLLALATAKESTTSRRPLLQPVAAEGALRETDAVSVVVSGVPVYASSAVAAGVIWGVPKRTSVLIVSGDPELAISADAGFKSDVTWVRATLRVGFAFPKPSSIVRITVDAD
jgi:HK97 family phage major capsid protein